MWFVVFSRDTGDRYVPLDQACRTLLGFYVHHGGFGRRNIDESRFRIKRHGLPAVRSGGGRKDDLGRIDILSRHAGGRSSGLWVETLRPVKIRKIPSRDELAGRS